MDEIRQRLRELRIALDLSQKDFAQKIFISRAMLGSMELGNRNINNRILQLITFLFNVNKDWLLTGKGEMFTAPPPDIQFEKLYEVFKQLNKPLRDCLWEHSKNLLKAQQENNERSTD